MGRRLLREASAASALAGWAPRTELTAGCRRFRAMLATKVVICRPVDPEAKGLVDRLHDYLERSPPEP